MVFRRLTGVASKLTGRLGEIEKGGDSGGKLEEEGREMRRGRGW